MTEESENLWGLTKQLGGKGIYRRLEKAGISTVNDLTLLTEKEVKTIIASSKLTPLSVELTLSRLKLLLRRRGLDFRKKPRSKRVVFNPVP